MKRNTAYDQLLSTIKTKKIKKEIGTELGVKLNEDKEYIEEKEEKIEYEFVERDPLLNIKYFKNNTTYLEDIEEVDKAILSINYNKKVKDVWFQHFYLSEEKGEIKEKRYHSIKGYESLGEQVFCTFEEGIEKGEKFIENDLRKRWKEEFHNMFKNQFQKDLFNIISNYRDLYFPNRNVNNEQDIINTYSLHMINHLLKTKRLLWNHDDKKLKEKEFKDSGFSNPRILILVPFRNNAYQIVNNMMKWIPKLKSIRRREAFELTFTDGNIDLSSKPKWYKQIFQGSVDDDFALGVLLKNGQLEIMSNLNESDVIIATPLGIEKEKKKMIKLLSNIELLIIDELDIIQMQNWEHFINSIELTNQDYFEPNIERIRRINLENKMKQFRQTIVFSRYMTSEINSFFQNQTFNIRGSLKIRNTYSGLNFSENITQIFYKIDSNDVYQIEDKRKDLFLNQIYPKIEKDPDGVYLIICSNYLDFILLRNNFKEDFIAISEYTENFVKELKKLKEKKYLIYTERHFFFNGTSPKVFPINQIIFYSLPENAFTYNSFVSKAIQIKKSYPKIKIQSIFSKFDILKLERILGTKKSLEFLQSNEFIQKIE